MHLIDVNPFVTSVFRESMVSGKSSAFIPRQRAPFPQTLPAVDCPLKVLGISSFAFQGTNAHAVVAQQIVTSPVLKQGLFGQLIWQRKLCWYTVLPHHMVKRLALGQDWIDFQADVASAVAAYLNDHKVAPTLLSAAQTDLHILIQLVA